MMNFNMAAKDKVYQRWETPRERGSSNRLLIILRDDSFRRQSRLRERKHSATVGSGIQDICHYGVDRHAVHIECG